MEALGHTLKLAEIIGKKYGDRLSRIEFEWDSERAVVYCTGFTVYVYRNSFFLQAKPVLNYSGEHESLESVLDALAIVLAPLP